MYLKIVKTLRKCHSLGILCLSIKTVDSDETILGLSVIYGKSPFSRPERELGIFIINSKDTMEYIYDANINFSAAFLIWVLVIRSLQSMLFSLEYKIKKYLDQKYLNLENIC